MTTLTRRDFLVTSASLAIGGFARGCAARTKGGIAPKAGPRVVVVGGGWGGATAAKYTRLADAALEVVLFEPNRRFISCPFSNLVVSGVRTIEGLTFGYSGLRRHGVRVVHEAVAAIEPDARRVRVGAGYVEYDRLILSPGVEFQWERIEGLAENQDRILYAWKAGPPQAEQAPVQADRASSRRSAPARSPCRAGSWAPTAAGARSTTRPMNR